MKVKTGNSGGGMFKHLKDIDGATVERSSSPAAETYASDPTGHFSSSKNPLGKFLGKFKGEERLHRAEQHFEDALNRSEHDEMTRPWHSTTKHHDSEHYERRSFRNVKYIDEKDEAWQTKSCGGSVGGGVDHITDHYSDTGDGPMNKSMLSLDRSDRHSRSNQPHQQHHETMLQVMERLAREEEEAKIAADVDKAMKNISDHKNHPNCDALNLRRCYSNNDKREVPKGGSKSMLEAMEQLMGKESVKLGHVAERPKLTDPRKVKSEKPLQPAIRKPFAPRA